MWAPDVYQGAPTAVTLFIGSAPKLAAFGFVMRLLVEGMGEMSADWQGMLVILAVMSMAVGNIAAIAQQTFEDLELKNITLTKGDFENTLPALLTQIKNIDLAFVDGNQPIRGFRYPQTPVVKGEISP